MTSVAEPVDVAVNPNDTTQRYVLWGNGRVDNIGGCPAITSGPSWFDRLDQPVAVALHVLDWTTGKGYVLDFAGGVQQLNAATALGTGSGTGGGQSGVDCTALGLPYLGDQRRYVDWSWDPAGSGHFVVLDLYGQLYAVNGATAPSRSGARWGYPAAKKLQVNWSAGQPTAAFTLDWYGGLQGDYSAPVPSGYGYWPGNDVARDLVVTDWSTPKGYTLDLYGGLSPFGGAPIAYGEPYRPGADVGRKVKVISAANPLKFWEVWAQGQQFDWTASTAPTVSAGGTGTLSPADTVTTTSRPTLAWAYSDAQADSQAAWQVYLFAQAFVDAHDMTDPSVWASSAVFTDSGVDPARRGTVPTVDLTNGAWRFYVRAQDTSGLWSAWANRGWTQNVPAPATPTGLTATASGHTVALSCSCTTGGSANQVRFECSDDGGTTWAPVRGADTVTLAATTTATDYDIPQGTDRQYRAVAFATSPRVASAPSSTATATIGVIGHLFTSTANPALGGRVKVSAPPSWSRTAKAGVFEIVGGEFPVVVSDGVPKSRRGSLPLTSMDADAYALIEGLALSNSTLLYRDPFGEAIYFRMVGDWTRQQIVALAQPQEKTPLRHMHGQSLALVEVQAPQTLDVASTVPPGPAGTA